MAEKTKKAQPKQPKKAKSAKSPKPAKRPELPSPSIPRKMSDPIYELKVDKNGIVRSAQVVLADGSLGEIGIELSNLIHASRMPFGQLVLRGWLAKAT